MLMNADGILMRGPGLATPKEVYTPEGWKPYKGTVPKPIGWADECDEAEAKRLIAATDARKKKAAPEAA